MNRAIEPKKWADLGADKKEALISSFQRVGMVEDLSISTTALLDRMADATNGSVEYVHGQLALKNRGQESVAVEIKRPEHREIFKSVFGIEPMKLDVTKRVNRDEDNSFGF